MAISWDYKLRQWTPMNNPSPYAALDRHRMVDAEIDALKQKYIEERITLDELEEQIANWLKWENMNATERLEFERTHDSIRWEDAIRRSMKPPPPFFSTMEAR